VPEILILADDLSGAADCAGGCAAQGWETLVTLEASARKGASATVLAIDLNSREGPADRAARAMREAIGLVPQLRGTLIYHKIDSTLRGNWAHELAAARQAIAGPTGAAPLAIIAPAFPERGRITRRGRMLVRADGSAELTDAGEIAVALHLLGVRGHDLDRAALRQPTPRLADELSQAAGAGVGALICDAETPQDLAAIAAAGLTARAALLWVGSAGLMRQLARQLPHPPRARLRPAAVRGPILCVVGSAAAAARIQFEVLAAVPEVASLRLAADDLQAPQDAATQRLIAAHLEDAIGRGHDAAVLLAPGRTGSGRLDPGLVARLAQLIGPWLDRAAGLVATGGETARHLLEKAGIWGIRLTGEVEVGVPQGIGLGQRTLPIVTKAGAFGDSEALVRCRAALRESARDWSP
jgi:D-threonate/D-erythronate kinase